MAQVFSFQCMVSKGLVWFYFVFRVQPISSLQEEKISIMNKDITKQRENTIALYNKFMKKLIFR